MLVRPLIREAGARMGGPPQRPLMGDPLVRGPRPLMADIPLRGPGLYIHILRCPKPPAKKHTLRYQDMFEAFEITLRVNQIFSLPF